MVKTTNQSIYGMKYGLGYIIDYKPQILSGRPHPSSHGRFTLAAQMCSCFVELNISYSYTHQNPKEWFNEQPQDQVVFSRKNTFAVRSSLFHTHPNSWLIHTNPHCWWIISILPTIYAIVVSMCVCFLCLDFVDYFSVNYNHHYHHSCIDITWKWAGVVYVGLCIARYVRLCHWYHTSNGLVWPWLPSSNLT